MSFFRDEFLVLRPFTHVVLVEKKEKIDRARKRQVVRLVLVFAALGWGISIWFTLVPWEVAMAGLGEMGAEEIAYDPFLDYWMRVVGMIFFLIGLCCLWVAWSVQHYGVMVPLLGCFHLAIGLGSAVLAWQLGMNPSQHPTLVAEVIFSLTIGIALLLFYERASCSMTCRSQT